MNKADAFKIKKANRAIGKPAPSTGYGKVRAPVTTKPPKG